jgi:hypothetical protein
MDDNGCYEAMPKIVAAGAKASGGRQMLQLPLSCQIGIIGPAKPPYHSLVVHKMRPMRLRSVVMAIFESGLPCVLPANTWALYSSFSL